MVGLRLPSPPLGGPVLCRLPPQPLLLSRPVLLSPPQGLLPPGGAVGGLETRVLLPGIPRARHTSRASQQACGLTFERGGGGGVVGDQGGEGGMVGAEPGRWLWARGLGRGALEAGLRTHGRENKGGGGEAQGRLDSFPVTCDTRSGGGDRAVTTPMSRCMWRRTHTLETLSGCCVRCAGCPPTPPPP